MTSTFAELHPPSGRTRSALSWLVGLLAFSAFALLLAACSRTARLVDDGAKVMSFEQAKAIERFHHFLLIDYDIDYRVLTVAGAPGGINSLSEQTFTSASVGSKSKTGRGLLLVLDVASNQVRLEVSRALEANFPDAFVGYIQTRQMSPFFAAGRVADGILGATEMIVTRAQNATAKQGWDDETWFRASTAGAGATTAARLNEGTAPSNQPAGSNADAGIAGQSPQATLDSYLAAMASHNTNSQLMVYSEATRATLNGWIMTTAQADNIVSAYRSCKRSEMIANSISSRAVIRYPIALRQCSPWFFVHESGAWRLDLKSQQSHIRFGRDNSWHFASEFQTGGEYRFAFEDWSFNRDGYPQEK